MAIPIRNTVFDKIKEAKRLTDVELFKSLVKDGHAIAEDRFNKILLDLEILGLVTVSWITKEERRIEIVIIEKPVDKIQEQVKETEERDYEASFPGAEK